MSTVHHHRQRHASPNGAVSTWAATLIVVVTLVIGVIWSVMAGSVGVPLVVLFGFGTLAAVYFVELPGLFVTVMQLPVLFALATVTAGWFITRQSSHGNMSKTALLTSFFPLAQLFPFLALIVLGAALLAWAKLRLAKIELRHRFRKAQRSRPPRRPDWVATRAQIDAQRGFPPRRS